MSFSLLFCVYIYLCFATLHVHAAVNLSRAVVSHSVCVTILLVVLVYTIHGTKTHPLLWIHWLYGSTPFQSSFHFQFQSVWINSLQLIKILTKAVLLQQASNCVTITIDLFL